MAIKESVTIEEVLELLNRAVDEDGEAMTALVQNRVPCNDALASDPTIQVGRYQGSWCVGLVGIINGLFGVDDDGWGPIGGQMNLKTKRIDRFTRVQSKNASTLPDGTEYRPKATP